VTGTGGVTVGGSVRGGGERAPGHLGGGTSAYVVYTGTGG
jgi:hypothetical protein